MYSVSKKVIHVVAAVISDCDNNVLLAKRLKGAHQGGLWEFPGGKVEAGELPRVALSRELREELDIEAAEFAPLIQVHHNYPDKSVFLDVWRVLDFSGIPRGAEGQSIEWVRVDQLRGREFPKANVPIVTAVELPQDYVITRDVGSQCTVDDVLVDIDRNLQRGRRLIQLRLKTMAGDLAGPVITKAFEMCAQVNATLMINSDIAGACSEQFTLQDGLVGLHLTGRALMRSSIRPKGYRWVAASCHDEASLRHAEAIGVDFVTLSSVCSTESHPGARALGWEAFEVLVKGATVPVFALGGVTLNNKTRAISCGAQGIAAIRAYC